MNFMDDLKNHPKNYIRKEQKNDPNYFNSNKKKNRIWRLLG